MKSEVLPGEAEDRPAKRSEGKVRGSPHREAELHGERLERAVRELGRRVVLKQQGSKTAPTGTVRVLLERAVKGRKMAPALSECWVEKHAEPRCLQLGSEVEDGTDKRRDAEGAVQGAGSLMEVA